MQVKVLNQNINKNYALYQGDCVNIMKGVPNNSIGLSVFSPPFSNLYVYSDSNRDMGNSKSDKEFYIHFQYLISELNRVIMQGRHCVIHCTQIPAMKQKDGYIGLKDFRGRLIRMFQRNDFIYHAEVTIWKCPVIEMTRTKSLGLLWKQLRKDSSRCRMGIPDYLIIMRKTGDNMYPIKHTPEAFPVKQWQEWASPVWMTINQSHTLQKTSARENKDERHICPLQLDVIHRALILWSNKNDTILSPFMGIGSEGYEAIKLGRKFIGIELKTSYYNQAVKNLKRASEERKRKRLI